MVKRIDMQTIVAHAGDLLTKIEQASNKPYEISVTDGEKTIVVGDFLEREISKIIPVAKYTNPKYTDTHTIESIANYLIKSEPRTLRDVEAKLSRHYHCALGLKVDKCGLKVYQEGFNGQTKVEAIIAKIELEPYRVKHGN